MPFFQVLNKSKSSDLLCTKLKQIIQLYEYWDALLVVGFGSATMCALLSFITPEHLSPVCPSLLSPLSVPTLPCLHRTVPKYLNSFTSSILSPQPVGLPVMKVSFLKEICTIYCTQIHFRPPHQLSEQVMRNAYYLITSLIISFPSNVR